MNTLVARLGGSKHPEGEEDPGVLCPEDRAGSPRPLDRLSPAHSPCPQEPPFQASLVADKYLLLEQVEGSSLCRCVDVRTQHEYVCKVRRQHPQIIFHKLYSLITH